ncbi:MAG: hypothetical protein ACRD0C_24580, partial [Acidimicrobiia bacterium]
VEGADLAELDRRAEKALDAYVAGLPVAALARCPLTGPVLQVAFDGAGLDGPFWRADRPARAELEAEPSTFLVLSGAMSLTLPYEDTGLLVRPGPAVPFVVPSLLDRPTVEAVVSTVTVGRHQGFAMAYFATDPPTDVEWCNTWGTERYWYRRDGSELVWSAVDDDTVPVDPDLARWIAAGKLSWIAPGDTELTLRRDVDGCPFLGGAGTTAFQRLVHGRLWAPDPATPRRTDRPEGRPPE